MSKRTSRAVLIASILAVTVAVIYCISTIFRLDREVRVLKPRADRGDRICNVTKNALGLDREDLRSSSARERMLQRIGGDCGPDSYVMLEWCLSPTFDLKSWMDAWHGCVTKHDDSCLEALLKSAEAAIPE